VIFPDQLFKDFNPVIEPYAFLDGGSLPTDIGLLRSLASSIEKCLYFEIGTWRGESVANIAAEGATCYTLNLSKEDLVRLGYPKKYADEHFFFSRGLDNVTQLEGNSLTFDFSTLNKKFDLIFIDGDHHYKMVKNDTEKIFKDIVHNKSIVVWHDYARNPESVRYEVLSGILDALPEKDHKYLYHFSNSLSALFIPREFEGFDLIPPVTPEGHFKIGLTYKR
jgi:predicted O-methyltransferase YrrM